jgi:hypothetical protein
VARHRHNLSPGGPDFNVFARIHARRPAAAQRPAVKRRQWPAARTSHQRSRSRLTREAGERSGRGPRRARAASDPESPVARGR